MGITAAIVVGAAALGGSAYQAVKSNEAKNDAEKAAADQEAEFQKQADDEKKQKLAQDQAAATLRSQQAKADDQRSQAEFMAAGSRRSTILTGPLGEVQPPSTANRTLLGG